MPRPRVLAALDKGDLEFIRAHAARLAPISLPDALRICLMVRDQQPERHETAAVRWLGRFALEARHATLDDLRHAADALAALPEQPVAAMEQLSGLAFAITCPGADPRASSCQR